MNWESNITTTVAVTAGVAVFWSISFAAGAFFTIAGIFALIKVWQRT